jgi:hypothetical protein
LFEVVDLAPEVTVLSRKSRIRSGPDFLELRLEGDDGRLKLVRPREVRLEECQDVLVKVFDPVDGPIGCAAKALTGLALLVKLELDSLELAPVGFLCLLMSWQTCS